jgi:hypothetical protein
MSGTTQDEILRATGGPTVNDGLSFWYGRTPQESLNDAELRWLKALPGVTANTINDAWRQYLKGLGFLGDLNDMWLAYWERQP